MICSVITRASKLEQFDANHSAAGTKLSSDIMEQIEDILDYHPSERHVG